MCATVVRVQLPCLWGKPPKLVFLVVAEDVLMSFCVASVALCTPLSTLHFKLTLYTPHSTLPTLHTSHFTLHTLHFTLHTLHSTLYTPHSTLYSPHSTSTFDSASPYIRFLYVMCIRVRWFLLFWISCSVHSPCYLQHLKLEAAISTVFGTFWSSKRSFSKVFACCMVFCSFRVDLGLV